MNCRRARHTIYEFVDGLGDEPRRLELEQHLVGCPECERVATGLTRSLDLLRRVPMETLDENFNWKVRLAINKERSFLQERASSEGTLFRAWNLRYVGASAGGFAVMLVAGWLAIGFDANRNDASRQLTTTPRADRTAPTLSDATRPGAGAASRPGNSELVAGGVSDSGYRGIAGAIDPADSPAELDSLVMRYISGMDTDAQARVLDDFIDVLKKRRTECDAKDKDKP